LVDDVSLLSGVTFYNIRWLPRIAREHGGNYVKTTASHPGTDVQLTDNLPAVARQQDSSTSRALSAGSKEHQTHGEY
jgi:hypothetical protein